MSDSGSGGGGVTRVPIGSEVNSAGTTTYNGVLCNQYTMKISSANGQAQTGVSLSAPQNVYLSQTTVNVPQQGTVDVTVYVPTTLTGTVNVTAYSAGHSNTTLTVQA
jgi:hypothetical protein